MHRKNTILHFLFYPRVREKVQQRTVDRLLQTDTIQYEKYFMNLVHHFMI